MQGHGVEMHSLQCRVMMEDCTVYNAPIILSAMRQIVSCSAYIFHVLFRLTSLLVSWTCTIPSCFISWSGSFLSLSTTTLQFSAHHIVGSAFSWVCFSLPKMGMTVCENLHLSTMLSCSSEAAGYGRTWEVKCRTSLGAENVRFSQGTWKKSHLYPKLFISLWVPL